MLCSAKPLPTTDAPHATPKWLLQLKARPSPKGSPSERVSLVAPYLMALATMLSVSSTFCRPSLEATSFRLMRL